MPELWACCEPCNRSFFVPFVAASEMSQTQCPVCCARPATFEIVTEGTSFDVTIVDGVDAPALVRSAR